VLYLKAKYYCQYIIGLSLAAKLYDLLTKGVNLFIKEEGSVVSLSLVQGVIYLSFHLTYELTFTIKALLSSTPAFAYYRLGVLK